MYVWLQCNFNGHFKVSPHWGLCSLEIQHRKAKGIKSKWDPRSHKSKRDVQGILGSRTWTLPPSKKGYLCFKEVWSGTLAECSFLTVISQLCLGFCSSFSYAILPPLWTTSVNNNDVQSCSFQGDRIKKWMDTRAIAILHLSGKTITLKK